MIPLQTWTEINMEDAVIQQFSQMLFCFLLFSLHFGIGAEIVETPNKNSFRIDGKVYVTSSKDKDWVSNTRVLIEGGKYRGFLRWVTHAERWFSAVFIRT